MNPSILYLDSKKSRRLSRSLGKHGDVSHAADVNEALVLMVDRDFDYFFVDADTPQAHAFLKHIHHDPQLAPPRGVVLLTDNDEEDCEAWEVDTYIGRARADADLPYVFSHLRGETGARHSDVLSIISVGPGPVEGSPPKVGRVLGTDPEDLRDGDADGGGLDSKGPGTSSAGAWPRESEKGERKPNDHPGGIGLDATFCEPGVTRKQYRKGRAGLYLVAFLVIAIGALVFAWGTFRGGSSQEPEGSTSTSAVTPDSSSVQEELYVPGMAQDDLLLIPPSEETLRTAPSSGKTECAAESHQEAVAVDEQGVVEPAEADFPDPPAAVSNRAPAAAVSGPSQVKRGQVVTYCCNATDPEGDGLSYSWGSASKSFCWSAPGVYAVSCTVTDPHGNSATGSMSVRVI